MAIRDQFRNGEEYSANGHTLIVQHRTSNAITFADWAFGENCEISMYYLPIFKAQALEIDPSAHPYKNPADLMTPHSVEFVKIFGKKLYAIPCYEDNEGRLRVCRR